MYPVRSTVLTTALRKTQAPVLLVVAFGDCEHEVKMRFPLPSIGSPTEHLTDGLSLLGERDPFGADQFFEVRVKSEGTAADVE